MIPESQTGMIWKKMKEAEVRALYFGDLATRYTKRKQIITGASFFFSSGAAATLAAEGPHWIPLILATLTALITSYSIAVGLDKKAIALSKLHAQWNRLASDYEHLWHHWYAEDSEKILEDLLLRAGQVSETATLEAPYRQKLLDKWADQVYAPYIRHTAA